MADLFCRIICASAGTGKTYRLSLEYIALLLQYYGKPEFSIDNILALTFTRKATAEIRDRINSQLSMLLDTQPSDKRSGLLQDLRRLLPGNEPELSTRERNLLLSAKREISCDHSRLQVMTIDAYIGNIFRNIVRPLRNIESFDIDTQAVTKRMPFLMNHLMQPAFRARLNKLLSRKVSRSLDAYAKLFASLIQGRWLYYMITQRLLPNGDNRETSFRVRDIGLQPDNNSNLIAFTEAMQVLLSLIHDIWQGQQKYDLQGYLTKDFRQIVESGGFSIAAIVQTLKTISASPVEAEKLLAVLIAKNIWSGSLIRKATHGEHTALMENAQQEAIRHLADHLMQCLYVPEQNEIIELWKIILDEYDRLIYRYKNMTYDDISWFSFEALFSEEPPFFDPQSEVSASEFYQFLSHRTRFLLIDEFQDTSLIQFNIIKPIIGEITAGEGSKPFGGLIVVGDEKQSIFGWRGGQRDLLLNLQSIFPSMQDVQTERLDQCWRCGFTLMQFINSLFREPQIHSYLADKKMNWEYNTIRSANAAAEPETCVELCLRNHSRAKGGQLRAEDIYADFVATMVVPAIQEDPTGSIAILCRKGKELSQIQQALDDCGIKSLYQPDRSICEHPLVSPLLDWLRFVAWGDWSNFLGFLRSDYLRINTALLKQVLDTIAQSQAQSRKNGSCMSIDFKAMPIIESLHTMAQTQCRQSLSHICRQMVDIYLANQDKSERDYLNLHKFQGIVTDWELNSSAGGKSIPDFLAYMSENAASEDFKQASVSVTDSLQLLTIHKSKGLQFKRVFVFYNLSGGHSVDSTRLAWALEYADKDFHQISDFGISYHYQKVLKASSYRHLWEAEQNRELLEEMNNLYVAFTRAESKLHLYFTYQNKDGWAEFLASRKEESLPALLCDSCLNYYVSKGIQADNRGIYRLESEYKRQSSEPVREQPAVQQHAEKDYSSLLQNIPVSLEPDWGSMKPVDKPTILDWKKVWLEERPNLLGDLAHYYLSFVIRNLASEHDYALRRCMLRFGSLLPRENILSLAELCHRTCQQNPMLFEKQWDKIFTELEIRGDTGLLRIDRLMLNTASNVALIVDYKSGQIHDTMQLEEYRLALQKLYNLSAYRIDLMFLKLDK
ncbi:MAG: hypothetical protein CVU50_02600 [Candidatus Cloacimonetes bacterium HGW-Cloacimonetes-3]|jgi:ATP-dependent exoDNAse (exonuclease V) beta subunit|nr:MAG: hypothetical protein CVU50_02600 [Candidatus Cloacimonetes bacterium HGW-Cloacimonetes-3]